MLYLNLDTQYFLPNKLNVSSPKLGFHTGSSRRKISTWLLFPEADNILVNIKHKKYSDVLLTGLLPGKIKSELHCLKTKLDRACWDIPCFYLSLVQYSLKKIHLLKRLFTIYDTPAPHDWVCSFVTVE